jgi:hypothetical protein
VNDRCEPVLQQERGIDCSGMDKGSMMQLDKALRAWGTPDFEAILKQEIAQSTALLPLQQGLSTGNYVADTPVTITIIGIAEMEIIIRVRAGIFYQGVIGGCSCADDPTPISDINEYCEVQLDIDKATAATVAVLAG